MCTPAVLYTSSCMHLGSPNLGPAHPPYAPLQCLIGTAPGQGFLVVRIHSTATCLPIHLVLTHCRPRAKGSGRRQRHHNTAEDTWLTCHRQLVKDLDEWDKQGGWDVLFYGDSIIEEWQYAALLRSSEGVARFCRLNEIVGHRRMTASCRFSMQDESVSPAAEDTDLQRCQGCPSLLVLSPEC